MFSLFTLEKWKLVKVLKHTGNGYTYHIRLYETNRGRRKAAFFCDGEKYNINRRSGYLKKTDFYQIRIIRWLEGRPDPEIPPYNKVDEYDTFDALKS